MGWLRRLLGRGGERPIPQLPPPPAGFEWQAFAENRVVVLRPEGWHVHQVKSNDSFTGCVSKEPIQPQGFFETGLTVQVLSRAQSLVGVPPRVAAIGMYEEIAGNEFNQLISEVCVQDTADLFAFVVRYRNASPVAKPVVIHQFYIAIDSISELYMFTFEGLEDSWDESWRIGEQMMGKLVVANALGGLASDGGSGSRDGPGSREQPPGDLLNPRVERRSDHTGPGPVLADEVMRDRLADAIDRRDADEIARHLEGREFIHIDVSGGSGAQDRAAMTLEVDGVSTLIAFTSREHANTFVCTKGELVKLDAEGNVPAFFVGGRVMLGRLPSGLGVMLNPNTGESCLLSPHLANLVREAFESEPSDRPPA